MYFYEPGPGAHEIYLDTPATPVSDWTAYRTIRNGDHYEVLYGVPGSGVWTSLGTYDAPAGSMSSGGVFRFYTGGTEGPSVWEIDNVSVTPEPTTMGLLGLGLVGLIARRKQK